MKVKLSKVVSLLLVCVMLINTCLPVSAYTGATDAADVSLQNGFSDDANRYEIYPIPQSIAYDGGESPTSFTLSNQVNVVYGTTIDQATKNFLEEVLTKYKVSFTTSNAIVTGKSNILIGVNGDNDAVNTYVKDNVTITTENFFEKTDAHLVSAKNGVIAILGRHADAAFYGVASLQMMFSSFAGKKFLNVQIEDFATMEKRGFIEGFYGEWSDAGRESLIRFGRDFKMNAYVYASKNDAYHTSKCLELYPQDKINEIERLVQIGEESKCRYVWSCHLNGFFGGLKAGDEAEFERRYQKLLAKFQQLYDVGVRAFDILNDDFGAGSHEDVVKLLNRLDTEFIQPKNCAKMTYCPQGYNIAWHGNSNELSILSGFNDTIDIYWTGHDVNSPITQECVDYVVNKSNHKPVIWVNYPVNEHGASGLLLGDIAHYARDNVQNSNGIIANGSKWAEANKVGFAQMASLAWNNNNFRENATEIWEDILKYVQPESYDSFLTLARNISNCPGSGRIPQGFPESEYIKEDLEYVLAQTKDGADVSSDERAISLKTEFENILDAIDTFKVDCTNETLIADMQEWMNSLSDATKASIFALESYNELKKGDVSKAWNALSKAISNYSLYNTHIVMYNATKKEAKGGSKRIEPFAQKMIQLVKSELTPIINPVPNAVLIGELSGLNLGNNNEAKKIVDGDVETAAEFNRDQAIGDYYGIDYGVPIEINDITILQGKNATDHDYFHYSVLETSLDGKTWTTLK